VGGGIAAVAAAVLELGKMDKEVLLLLLLLQPLWLVNGTGNPWVILAIPVPIPVKTRTRAAGTGFSAGTALYTQGYTLTRTRGG
jgi:hypothetical protein